MRTGSHFRILPVCRGSYHGQVFEDLDPISWSHVGDVVEVGGVGDELVPHLWISQHFSGHKHTEVNHRLPPEWSL